MGKSSFADPKQWHEKWKLQFFLEDALRKNGIKVPLLKVYMGNLRAGTPTVISLEGQMDIILPDPQPSFIKKLCPSLSIYKNIRYRKIFADHEFYGITRGEYILFRLEDVIEARIYSNQQKAAAEFTVKKEGKDLMLLIRKEGIGVAERNQTGKDYKVEGNSVREFTEIMVGYLLRKLKHKSKDYQSSHMTLFLP